MHPTTYHQVDLVDLEPSIEFTPVIGGPGNPSDPKQCVAFNLIRCRLKKVEGIFHVQTVSVQGKPTAGNLCSNLQLLRMQAKRRIIY